MRSSAEEPVVREYSRLAPEYDARWKLYVAASTAETLCRLRARPGDRVLDVGCGTGALLEALSERDPIARLVGVDAAAGMLAVAREKLGPRAAVVHGRADGLPFRDEAFDVVVSTNAFHFLRQPVVALGEMQRVLRPGGSLVITDWCDDYLACRVCDRLLRLFSGAHFRTYGAQECRRMLEGAGLRSIGVERYKISWLWGLMTATGRRSDRASFASRGG